MRQQRFLVRKKPSYRGKGYKQSQLLSEMWLLPSEDDEALRSNPCSCCDSCEEGLACEGGAKENPRISGEAVFDALASRRRRLRSRRFNPAGALDTPSRTAMATIVCPHCGRGNRVSRDQCWKCRGELKQRFTGDKPHFGAEMRRKTAARRNLLPQTPLWVRAGSPAWGSPTLPTRKFGRRRFSRRRNPLPQTLLLARRVAPVWGSSTLPTRRFGRRNPLPQQPWISRGGSPVCGSSVLPSRRRSRLRRFRRNPLPQEAAIPASVGVWGRALIAKNRRRRRRLAS